MAKERKTRKKTLTAKSYGIRKERERVLDYELLDPDSAVYHVRGSLGGHIDIIVARESPQLTIFVGVKAGGKSYIQQGRREFKAWVKTRVQPPWRQYRFDSFQRNSKFWDSEVFSVY